jgi:catechol 2,3-dioxygenase-like lactoylglutathione lyase family enzyme
MAITGLHHIGILVSDLSQAETFATEVLGLSVTRRVSVPEESTDAVLLECGGIQLELIAIHDPELRARRVRIPNAPAEIDHLALAVDNIDAEARRLAGHGLKFTAMPGQLVEAEEPVAIAGMRSLFSLPSTSSGLVWQLIEDRGDAGQ